VNPPRELAPVGWILPGDPDRTKLTYYLGEQEVAAKKIKSTSGWSDANCGTNEADFLLFHQDCDPLITDKLDSKSLKKIS
jgi:uncharacterized protein (TIGR02145 family)